MRIFFTQTSIFTLHSLQLNPAIYIIYISLVLSCMPLWIYCEADSMYDGRCLVTSPAGTYRGLMNTSVLYPEFAYCKFLGMKYAEALGNRRFGKPIPLKPPSAADCSKKSQNSEVYDAFSYGNACPSTLEVSSKIPLDEDCLSLNVFTPQTYQTANENSLRAVIVYIHGGGFSSGSSDVFSPDYLVPRDVLLIVMNYRLGPFGFLNLNITGCPGNMGLWDQSMALKWIRRNIKAFGGDPNRITLAGQSAGAISAYLHILSPASRDLFQRAIIQSPTTTYKFVRDDIVSKSIDYARFVGCPNDPNDREKILRCLQQKSRDDLLKGFHEFQTMLLQTDDAYYNYGRAFWPSEDASQQHPFLPSTSLEELGKKAPNIDVIIGQVSADAAAYFDGYNNSEVVAELQRNLDVYLKKEPLFVKDERILQIVIGKIKGYCNEDNLLDETQKVSVIDRKISSTYSPPAMIVKAERQPFIETLNTDPSNWIAWRLSSNLKFNELLLDITYSNWYTEIIPFLSASHHNGKIHIYQFRVDDDQSMKKWMFKKDYRLVEGAAHMEDLAYIYPKSSPPNFTVTPNQLRVIHEMTMYWSNFAKYGDPNSDSDGILVRWKPILSQPAQPNFLLIGDETTIFVEGRRIEEERRKFWDGLQSFAEQYYNYLSHMKLNFGENGLY